MEDHLQVATMTVGWNSCDNHVWTPQKRQIISQELPQQGSSSLFQWRNKYYYTHQIHSTAFYDSTKIFDLHILRYKNKYILITGVPLTKYFVSFIKIDKSLIIIET